MDQDTRNTPSQELSFEEAMAKLEELVAAMESGKLPLEKLISSYEEGCKLVKFCRSKLAIPDSKCSCTTPVKFARTKFFFLFYFSASCKKKALGVSYINRNLILFFQEVTK